MRSSSFSQAALFATAAVEVFASSPARAQQPAAETLADLMLGARGRTAATSGDVIADFLITGRPVRAGLYRVSTRLASPVAAIAWPRSGAAAAAPASGPVSPLGVAAIPADGPPQRVTSPVRNFPAPDPQTLLLLLVQLDELTLTEGMAAYGAPDDPLLPVGELSRLLELDIDVSPSEGRITGRLGEARRSLLIDLTTNTARVGAVQVPLAPGDVAVEPADIYVRASVLAQLLPLRFAVDSRALLMRLTATELLPIQGRLQRLARLRQTTPNPARQVMRVEEPYKLFTPPSFDVALGLGAQTIDPRTPTRYDIRLGGDLLYAGLQAYVGSDDGGRATTARVLLEKRSIDGNLLGPLHARVVGLGDVFTPGLAIGPRSVGGRGVEFSTAPLDQTSVFNRIDLRGELPLGDDVELYVNDVLQGAQQQPVAGRYEFLNVPLTQGVNIIRTVTYGPRGQRGEETRIINASGGLLRRGQATFDFGAVDQNEPLFRFRNDLDPLIADRSLGRSRVVANLNYGITQSLTGSLGGAVYSDTRGVQRDLYTAGLRTSIKGFATQLDLAADNHGGAGASVDVAGRVFGANALFRQSLYRGGLLDENNAESDITRPLSARTELTVDESIRFGPQVIPLTLRALRDVYADGGGVWIGQVRGSASLGSVLYSTGLEYDRNTAATGQVNDILRGSLGVSTFRNYQWQVRATLNYDVIPNVRPSDLEIIIDRTISNTWSLRFGATQRLDAPKGTQLLAGSTTRTRFGDLALTGQYDTTNNSWRLGAQMNFGIGYNPQTGYQLTRSGPGSGGSVAFHAFIDANGNGQFDPGERPVAGVILDGGEFRTKTDAEGRAYLSGFGAGTSARLLVGLGEIENQAVKTPPTVVEFAPRPGGVSRVEYPMRPTGEVMVNIKLRRPDQPSVGLSATRVRLIDARGVIYEGVTEFDGSANFQDVPIGTYRLELDKEQAARLRMHLTGPVSVTIRSEGAITPDVSAEVQFDPRTEADARPTG